VREKAWDTEIAKYLDRAWKAATADEALPHLRTAANRLDDLINENMALALVSESGSIGAVAQLAGFTENTIGPRLARSKTLGAYARSDGRVTASGVERAVYDRETGRAPASQSMRFVARKSTSKGK
jgi:hypothetical protein